MNKRIRRKITKTRNIPYTGSGGSNILYLECGHYTARKASQGIPKTVFCRECRELASGMVTSKQIGNMIETWDADTEMPVWTPIQNEKGAPRE